MKTFLLAMMDALRRLLADRGALSTMVISILIYSLLYPQPYVGEVVRDVPIAVVDQDNSTASRALLRRIDATDSVRILTSAPDQAAARDLFYARKVYGIVIVPARFEESLLAGRPSPVAAFGDGSYFLLYNAVMNAVAGAARVLGAEVQYDRLTAAGTDPGAAAALVSPITIASIPLFNPQGGYASYVVPAAFVLILQQTLLMGIGILHAGRRMGSGPTIVATPLVYVMLYCVWITFTQLLLPYLYGIPRLGNFGTLMAIAVPFLLAVTAMGFAIAQAIPWREGVIFFLVVMGMPLFFLSGISWPVEAIPTPILLISRLVPSSTAISAFVTVDQMGGSLQDVAQTIRLQLGLAAGYTVLALLLARVRGKAPVASSIRQREGL